MSPIIAIVLFGLLLGLAYAVVFVGRRERSLPPGPPTLPIIGNLHQIPTKGTHFKFTEWSKKYGGIYSLKMGPSTAIVLTDRRLVKQMIDKKSSIYSNRPVSYVAEQLITSGHHILTMNYSDLWRKCRKTVHQFFMESMCEKEHIVLQNAEAVQLVRDYLVSPQDHMLHPKRFSNSIIVSLLFGFRTPTADSIHMKKLYHLMENWSKIMEPGNTPPVDIFPFLHWVPESIFGNWVSRASNVGKEMNLLYADTLEKVEKRREVEGSRGSFLDLLLDQQEKLGLSRHEVYFLVGTLMEGGSDTTSSIVIAFVQAMTRWPEVQKKAQAEIDSVVGEDRTPLWSDYQKLPYVAACVKETMRWRPVTPLAFPHAVAEDDVVDGYTIPKGSTIFINVWGMHHDEIRFPDPQRFDPDHYKGSTALAPELAAGTDYEKRDHYGYGSGRRICPGIHLAERNLFLALSKLLWGFSFESKVQPDTDPVTGYCEGFLVCANPFDSEIKPRSEARKQTILREFAEAEEKVFKKYGA